MRYNFFNWHFTASSLSGCVKCLTLKRCLILMVSSFTLALCTVFTYPRFTLYISCYITFTRIYNSAVCAHSRQCSFFYMKFRLIYILREQQLKFVIINYLIF